MLRGVRIDLEGSLKAIDTLRGVYGRDVKNKELSDEAIAAVNTIVRSLEGALGKTANEVGQRLVSEKCHPYFPLTDDPSKFEDLLQKQMPGLRANHPQIADTFERHQPYRPGYDALKYLKALYREGHHHDFTLQESRQTQTQDFMVGGTMLFSIGPHGMTIGGPPRWRGVPVGQAPAPGAEVYVDGVLQPPESAAQALVTVFVDWYFTDPGVSVLGTLMPLHDLCAQACEDISQTAGL